MGEQICNQKPLVVRELRFGFRPGPCAIAAPTGPPLQGRMHTGVSFHPSRYAIRLPGHSAINRVLKLPLEAVSKPTQDSERASELDEGEEQVRVVFVTNEQSAVIE